MITGLVAGGTGSADHPGTLATVSRSPHATHPDPLLPAPPEALRSTWHQRTARATGGRVPKAPTSATTLYRVARQGDSDVSHFPELPGRPPPPHRDSPQGTPAARTQQIDRAVQLRTDHSCGDETRWRPASTHVRC